VIDKIKSLLKRKPDRVKLLEMRAYRTDAHLIAICRLMFIKPEVLLREVNNIKANWEYITELIKAKNEENSTNKKNK